MAQLRGMNNVKTELRRVIRNSFRTRVSAYITREMKDRLYAQVQPDGDAFPDKKESTIKQYKRKGWDTEHFLIRTGKSTPLKTRVSGDTLEVYPVGHETLAYHKDRVQWMGLTPEQERRVIEILSEDVRDAFRV